MLTFSQIECDNDVVILEGTTISMCKNALIPINASGGYVAYNWTGPINGASQSIIPTTSGQYIVFAEDAIGCISSDTIQVTVIPAPVDAIVSSDGDTLCNGSTTTLSLSGTYSMYNWTGGVTTPTLNVDQDGVYSVNVVDESGCVSTFTYTIESINFGLQIRNQNDCLKETTLEAFGGSTYVWSTGETTNSIVVSPEQSTVYNVTITEGNCLSNLLISVDPLETNVEEFSLPDTMYVESGEDLSIIGPSGVDNYLWQPATQLHDSLVQIVIFNGSESQEITLTATYSNGCVIRDTFFVVVVDLTIPNGFSPNGDELNDYFVIPELENYTASALVVWNRWGDVVFESEDYKNDWAGTCESGLCFGSGTDVPDGTYFYSLTTEGLRMEGYITIIR